MRAPSTVAEAEARITDELVNLYRARDGILNIPAQRDLLTHVTGRMAGLCAALCLLRGWDVEEEGGKEGAAEQMVIRRWQELFPEEWAS